MASIQDYQNGVDADGGPSLITALRLLSSGYIWYLGNASGGVDAASPVGRESQSPLATLAQAHTNAAAGDIIVVLPNHSEALVATQTFNKAGLILAFAGTGTARGRFTRAADTTLFDITAAGVIILNAWLPASTVLIAAANPKIKVSGASCLIEESQIDCGANDASPGIQLNTGADRFEINDTTIQSTSTSLTSRPLSAIKVNQAVSDMRAKNLVLDGGTVGWSRPHAFDGTAAITRMLIRNEKQLRGSDVILPTGNTGNLTPGVSSGSARVEWTP